VLGKSSALLLVLVLLLLFSTHSSSTRHSFNQSINIQPGAFAFSSTTKIIRVGG